MTRHTQPGRMRSLALALLAGLVGAMLAVAALSPAAQAETTTTANTWTYTMDAPGTDGLVIEGVAGPNSNALLVKDYLDQPIFSVLQAGGAAVYGDDFRVIAGTDVFHGQITISADNPNAAVCVRNGQLWIGGPAGHIWRCADLDGGMWSGGWWQSL